MIRPALILTCFCATALPVAAQQTPPPPPADATPDLISAERPGFTNGTDTVESGRFQYETGYLYQRQAGVAVNHLNDQGQLRLPFRPNAEFRVGLPAYYFASVHEGAATGFTDAGVSIKWRFLAEEPRRHPSLALIAGTSLPSGGPALRSSALQPQAAVEAQYNLSALYQLQGDVVAARANDNGKQFGQYAGAVNVTYNVSPTISPFLEVYRISALGANGAPGASYGDGGITYFLGHNIQLDLNAGVGLSHGVRGDHYFGAGFCERWN
jgi:hypothetical protein